MAILLGLTMLPSWATIPKTKNRIQITPSFLMQELADQMPKAKCSQTTSYFRTCFEMSQEACSTGLKQVLDQAGKKVFGNRMQDRMELTLAASYYSYQLGDAAGALFEEKFQAQKKSLPECYQLGAFPE